MKRHFLFDLDNTLYPESSGLEEYIYSRMLDFSADWLGCSREEAKAAREASRDRYRLTLSWLSAEHGFSDPDAFYRFVHPEDEVEFLRPVDGLAEMLDSISEPKWVFTNGPLEHAERVLSFLGVRDRFGDVFDIRFCDFRGKPERESYLKVCRAIRADPMDCVLFDDNGYCLDGIAALGGKGVLVDEAGRHAGSVHPRISSVLEIPALLRAGVV